MKKTPQLLTALALAGAMATLAGCTAAPAPTTTTTTDPSAPAELTAVRVAAFPQNALNAAIYLGIDQGIFEAHGLDVSIVDATPDVAVSTVASGAADFGWTSPSAVLLARASGVDVISVAPFSVSGEDPDSFPYKMLVTADSPIESLEDLGGKNLGVDRLGQWPQLFATTSLAAAGVDTSTVQLTEVAQANMLDALNNGTVDAALLNEPSITNALAGGARVISNLIDDKALQNMVITTFLTSSTYLDQHPEIVEAFRAAVAEMGAYANAHPDELRAVMPTISAVTADVADVIRIYPFWTGGAEMPSWEQWITLLTDAGQLTTDVPLDEAVYQG